MKNIVYTIGEALIDFVPTEKGKALYEAPSFQAVPGGAPANVAAVVAKLGGYSKFISKLGQDAFGDYIVKTLEDANVDTTTIKRDKKAKTGLAFITLDGNGERNFSFYRDNCADMLLEVEDVDGIEFKENDIFHYGSIGLISEVTRKSHEYLIDRAREAGSIISFDPNIRLNLWDNEEECKARILEFLPKADIIKISDDELYFITGINNKDEAIKSLFKENVKVVLYTKGPDGSEFITRDRVIKVDSIKVDTVDTTGAGDSFIGTVLCELSMSDEVFTLMSDNKIVEILTLANKCAAKVTTKKGVISSIPSREELF